MAKENEEKKKLPYEELEKNYSELVGKHNELVEDHNKLKESDDKLKNICHQLSDQSQTLYQKLQEANLSNMFKRLDYLFAVIEHKDVFSEYPEFFANSVKEIVDTMTIPEEPVAAPASEEKPS